MSNLSWIIRDDQVKKLQEINDALNSAVTNKQSVYLAKEITATGTIDILQSREEYLESVIDWALNAMGATLEFLE